MTFHHFTTPRWAAADGGWENPTTVDRFARFCERAGAHLGDVIAIACTINEPNVVALMGYLPRRLPARHEATKRATRKVERQPRSKRTAARTTRSRRRPATSPSA